MEQATQQVFPEREAKEQVLEAAAIPCLNCGQTLTGKYCNECGQSSATSRLSVREILVNLWHTLTETDFGIVHLIKELAYRPGHVTREYIEGKRKKYFNPWSFFVLASAAYVFAATSSGYFKNIATAQAQLKTKEEQKLFEEIFQIMEGHLKEFNFLFIPLLAGLFWLLYRKSKLNFAEHLVFQAYMYGFVSVTFIVLVLPFITIPKLFPILNVLYPLWMVGYITLASKQLFQNSWVKTTLKSLFIYVVYFVLIIALVVAYVGYKMKFS